MDKPKCWKCRESEKRETNTRILFVLRLLTGGTRFALCAHLVYPIHLRQAGLC